jgi:hypothetical protein
MEKYISKVPFIEKDIYCYELPVRLYKVILKALLSDTFDLEVLNNLNNVISKITNLTLDEVNNLNFVEYFILLIYIRAINVSGYLPLIMSNKDSDKKTNLSVNLYNTLESLSKLLTNKDTLFFDGGIALTVGLPNYKKIIEDTSSYTFFIKKITINDNVFTTSDDILQIVKILTPSALTNIRNYEKEIAKILKDIFFFKTNVEQFCIPYDIKLDEQYFLIQLLFGDDLSVFYSDMFYLAKYANISLEYLENCTPGEFKIFAKNLEASIKESSPSEEQTDTGDEQFASFPTI